MKRQPTDYKKVSANHISEKEIKNSQHSAIKPKQSHLESEQKTYTHQRKYRCEMSTWEDDQQH